jgi:hypothetical protein
VKDQDSKYDSRKGWFEEYCRMLDEQSVHAAPQPDLRYACPCCHSLTLEERGGFDICPICFWEDDGQDDADADIVRGGPNHALSLTQASENFLRIGAVEDRFLKNVRAPLPSEQPK